MDLVFRCAKKEDLPDIIKLTNECFGEHTSLTEAKKIWDRFFNDPNHIYINGYLGDQLVAHTKVTIIPTIYNPMKTYAMINHLCVKPEIRRQHIGTHLLDYCVRVAREYNCVEISLWSKNFRIPAHALYLKYGFKIIDAKFFTLKLKEQK